MVSIIRNLLVAIHVTSAYARNLTISFSVDILILNPSVHSSVLQFSFVSDCGKLNREMKLG